MFWQRFFKKKEVSFNFNRILKYNYFKNKHNNDIQKNGYTIIKNVVSKAQLQFLEDTYHQLTKFPEYTIEEKFQNSGRFRSPEIRNFVMDNIGKFSKEFLPSVFDKDIYDENTTGAFQIKPPSKVSELNPHQDAPVIDETKENGLFVWIPLCDITENNGAVLVLPGSHLWQNHQRSLNVSWVFEKHTKLLWKYMQPIYINRGDILVWDTALIHASLPNLSNQTRVAITTTLLPKSFKMVEYFKDAQTPIDEVEKYQVEKSFWESEDIMKRPPCPPNQYFGNEKIAFQSDISKKQVLLLLEQTQEYIDK
jgi:hypothetical protein